MSFQTLRLLMVFVCVWLLVFHEQDVNGMRNIDLVLKRHERRMQEAKRDVVVNFQPKSSSQGVSTSSDLDEESKRRRYLYKGSQNRTTTMPQTDWYHKHSVLTAVNSIS
ncbi:hypothetical protein FCM35_KLT11718 [Carex littledalei]|uniref:Uncharacterized protein n=1 Tax=Carex littledalei TaxID=544730 RepID=A0A833V3Q2_9POAL|nr:hypothetical protein FCM35_KLT11718 [Carex littledalei]